MMDQDEDFKERDCGYVESDEETRMAEKDLAEDAQWKIFQKNTFTRWANEHFKKADLHIDDLETDLSDGLRLVALVEILSGHKFRHINKRPTFRTQKLENVATILKYLEETEGLRLISIDSSRIVDCNLKLILGLIWALILHYSISVPLISEEENLPDDDKNQIQGPKQRLLSWVKQKMPSVPVRNFTTDWNDGIAIGALVDACAPGLCPDWTHWDHRKPLRNATEAMLAAEDWLSVPQLIRPEEMVDPNVDEKSMMTYISQFPNARLKEGAPLRAKLNPSKVRAYGPGLELNENRIGVPAKFYVETVNAGKGQLDVLVINSRGVRETCEVVFDSETNQTYSCVYEPRLEGEHRIVIKYGGQEIPNSPFRVNIKGIFVDPSKVTVSGPGVQKSELNCVGRRTHFMYILKFHPANESSGNEVVIGCTCLGFYFSLLVSHQLYLEPLHLFLFKIVFSVGGISGNIMSYYLYCKHEYKKNIYLMHIFAIVGWFFICTSESWISYDMLTNLLIGRFATGISIGIGFCIMPVMLQHTLLNQSWRHLTFSLPCFMTTLLSGISFFLAFFYRWQLTSVFYLLFSIFGLCISLDLSKCFDSIYVLNDSFSQSTKQMTVVDSSKKPELLERPKIALFLPLFQVCLGPEFLINNAQLMCSNAGPDYILCHANINLLLIMFTGTAVLFVHRIYGVWNLFICSVLAAIVYYSIYAWNITHVGQVLILPLTASNILMIILCGVGSFGWGQLPYIMMMNKTINSHVLSSSLVYINENLIENNIIRLYLYCTNLHN
ncbi:hypothetical protein MN116_005771 [Schistosoma mekongi]|uniref:Calponin-homology (CH) domain-containing protein n=1 Tax=Schistosoma mekongi TaxID=38744 RepID=A0AAE1ZAB2_SCHME|nr:hypothetical protein MN116_005771 [Schistosoma mekongi]